MKDETFVGVLLVLFVLMMSLVAGSMPVPTPFPPPVPDQRRVQFFPNIVNDAPFRLLPATVFGVVLDEEGHPRNNTVVRLAEVWCEDYEKQVGCYTVLDMAFDPGDCTAPDGSYEMKIEGWYLENVYGWLLVVGRVDQDDYVIIYNGWSNVIKVMPGGFYDLGETEVDLLGGTCSLVEGGSSYIFTDILEPKHSRGGPQ